MYWYFCCGGREGVGEGIVFRFLFSVFFFRGSHGVEMLDDFVTEPEVIFGKDGCIGVPWGVSVF